MKRFFLIMLTLFSFQCLAADSVIIAPELNQNLVLKVNKAGVPTNVLSFNGATGVATFPFVPAGVVSPATNVAAGTVSREESGSCTLLPDFSTSNGTADFAQSFCEYYKVGKIITVAGGGTLTKGTGTGWIRLSGMPATNANSGGDVFCRFTDTSLTTNNMVFATIGSTSINFMYRNLSTGSSSALLDTGMAATADISFQVTYWTP